MKWGLGVAVRLDQYVSIGEPEEHWLWLGNSSYTHPKIRVTKVPPKIVSVRRLLWEMHRGPLHKKIIQATCEVKLCVNPFHAEKYTPEKRKLLIRRLGEERKKILWDYKAERGCSKCQEKDPVALDFHHRDPKEKSFDLSRSGRRNIDLVRVEIIKCDVLCANCHRKTHKDYIPDGITISTNEGVQLAPLASH